MLAIAILAAGKGTRMKSALPKVLHPLAGISMVERVLMSCNGLSPQRRLLIVGHQAEYLEEALSHIPGLEFVLQKPQRGTGHAIQQLLPILKDFEGELLVLNGDIPLLRPRTITKLIEHHRSSVTDVTILTAKISNPEGYGRVFVDQNDIVNSIIEERDCTQEQLNNTLTNAGIYCFNWKQLAKVLPKLNNENNQGELYLTDTIAMLSKPRHIAVDDSTEVNGVNDRKQMSNCESFFQQRLRDYWMKEGVTFLDESSCTISENSFIGKDVIIEPQTHLRGRCRIGQGCHLGPGSLLSNVELGSNVKVSYSVLKDAKIGDGVEIGPFAHIRPEAVISDDCKVGNFVEIKKSQVGTGTKISHLSYIGDAELGSNVNIGAGTITANFDGETKNRTIIGNESKTGANSVLVAPITLGSQVTVGAGSTLTKDVPNGSLALGRAKQLVKRNWSPSTKAQD